MCSAFSELKLFQVKPDKVDDFEQFIKDILPKQEKQSGCLSIRYFKRFYTLDGVKLGEPPRQLTKIIKCVKYYSYWEYDTIENFGKANGWFFDNYEKVIQKFLIVPFDINSGYLII